MQKIKLGIFPTLKESKNKYDDKHEYLTRYLEVLPDDVTPILLTIVNNNVQNLELCDAFLLPGGSIINENVYKVIDYAYENRLPLLGICLGMQALAVYSCLKCENIDNCEDFVIKKLPTNSHCILENKEGDLHEALHSIFIEPTSKLYEYVGKQQYNVYSFHHDNVNHISKLLKVTSFSADGILESIESNIDNWLAIGLQFHPELDKNDVIIKSFVKDVKKCLK